MMTEFLIIASPKAGFSANLQLKIGQEIVLPSTSCKSLGVMFDDHMQMDAHISYICRTIHFHFAILEQFVIFLQILPLNN